MDGWEEVDDLDIGSDVDSSPEETKQLDPVHNKEMARPKSGSPKASASPRSKDSSPKREGWEDESSPKVDVEGWDDPDLVLDDSDIDL